MTAALGRVSAAALEAVAAALDRGALSLTASPQQLGRWVEETEAHALLEVLAALRQAAMERAQAVLTLRLLAESRRAAESAPRPKLVWSDLDVRGSRDTAVVAHELFREAERSVLISTYNLGHKRREGEPPGHPVLRPLTERMSVRPNLRARLFLNIKRMPWQTDAAEATVVADFARWFRGELWPWPRLPAVYYDPRSLSGEEDSACLHAKCIVVDDERALVTSANLTTAAQSRNIEAGVLLQDPAFAKSLRLQLEALINRGLVREVRLSE